ncbi:MAG: HEAT repeat domain-containing protein [Terrimicrobiaceae bacterium]
MKPTLTKCQFVAFGSGVLLCGVLLLVVAVVIRPLNEWFYQHIGGRITWVALQTMVFIPPVAFAFAVARYAGRYDKVAFITCAVPALAAFLIGYLLDINTYIESAARHAMTGGCLGFVPPLHVPGQLSKMFFPALWAALSGAIGIGLHRLTRKKVVVAESEPVVEVSHAFRWFVLALGVGVVASLIGYASYVAAKNTPGARVSHAEKVLAGANSSVTEKSRAIWDLWHLRDDGSTRILQEAVKNQPAPLNVLAAAFLANRNDLTGLPLLEVELMKSSELKSGGVNLKMGLMLQGIENPEAIPVLVKLMKSPDKGTRSGAVQALRNTKSKDAIESLVSGLYDEEWQVRWISTLGLAEIVGHGKGEKSWGPAHDTFKKDEQLYLDHWREWAKNRPSQ